MRPLHLIYDRPLPYADAQMLSPWRPNERNLLIKVPYFNPVQLDKRSRHGYRRHSVLAAFHSQGPANALLCVTLRASDLRNDSNYKAEALSINNCQKKILDTAPASSCLATLEGLEAG